LYQKNISRHLFYHYSKKKSASGLCSVSGFFFLSLHVYVLQKPGIARWKENAAKDYQIPFAAVLIARLVRSLVEAAKLSCKNILSLSCSHCKSYYGSGRALGEARSLVNLTVSISYLGKNL
jgi:hypothetical protein